MKPFTTISYPRLAGIVPLIKASAKRVRSVYKLPVVSLSNDDNILMNLIVVKQFFYIESTMHQKR